MAVSRPTWIDGRYGRAHGIATMATRVVRVWSTRGRGVSDTATAFVTEGRSDVLDGVLPEVREARLAHRVQRVLESLARQRAGLRRQLGAAKPATSADAPRA